MDELELLKQDWKRQEKNLPHVESSDIEKMMHKKSTTIVKWIFIISIAEFLFWIGIESLSLFQDSYQIIVDLGLESFYRVSLIINYVAIAVFITLFFLNFRKIRTSDNIKRLLKSIVYTRKTVKTYVWFNIIFFILSFAITAYIGIEKTLGDENIEVKLLSLGIMIAIMLVALGLLLLFYMLLYGILTRRLKKNYNILKKIEAND